MSLRALVITAAWIVFVICVYAFLLGNEVFKGEFKNESVPWYFLAKGIFCGLALYLLYSILEQLRRKTE